MNKITGSLRMLNSLSNANQIEHILSIINDFNEKFNLHMKLKKTQSYHSWMWKYVEKPNTHLDGRSERNK